MNETAENAKCSGCGKDLGIPAKEDHAYTCAACATAGTPGPRNGLISNAAAEKLAGMFLDEDQLAAVFKVSKNTLRALRHGPKKMPHVKIGMKVIYLVDSLVEWMKANGA